MKNLHTLLIALMMIIGFNSRAQDSNNPWAISFGVNAVDTKNSASSKSNSLDATFPQMYNYKKNWNAVPVVSYVEVSRYIGDVFSFGVSGSLNKISKAVYFNPTAAGSDTREYIVSNPGDLNYFGVDGVIKYSMMHLIKSKVIDPSIQVGGGYTFFGKSSYGTENAGVGLTFWVTENIGISVSSTYKKSFFERVDREGLIKSPTYFQHLAGLTFTFGGKDTDGDGIYDKEDACPMIAGPKKFKGCPDTDEDGIIDRDDACPEVAGLAEFQGCPDTDGDGVVDKEDACPTEAGIKALKGCPDRDGDGVADKEDKCLKVKGPKENAGCPWPDTDGDGVVDKDDQCPDVKGTVVNNGCPEVSDDISNKLKEYSKSILFNTGAAFFKKEAVVVLQSITGLLNQYPSSRFLIEGHTDSVGATKFNQSLSEKRAGSVKNYLTDNGIGADRLKTIGFGEKKPNNSNRTAAGKAKNRRVEVKLVKE